MAPVYPAQPGVLETILGGARLPKMRPVRVDPPHILVNNLFTLNAVRTFPFFTLRLGFPLAPQEILARNLTLDCGALFLITYMDTFPHAFITTWRWSMMMMVMMVVMGLIGWIRGRP